MTLFFSSCACAQAHSAWANALHRKGLLLQRLNQRDKALEALILSVTAYPWNWSAWQAMVRCIKDKAELTRLRPLLPLHPMQAMLHLYYGSQLQAMEEEELDECDRLLTIFPGCPIIIGWKAHCLYIMKGTIFVHVL